MDGVVADVTDYKPDGMFDVILVDRTLHMLSEEPRLSVLEQLLDHVDVDGWVLIADEATNNGGFEAVISCHQFDWKREFSKRGYLFVRRVYHASWARSGRSQNEETMAAKAGRSGSTKQSS